MNGCIASLGCVTDNVGKVRDDLEPNAGRNDGEIRKFHLTGFVV
jgi:hypothetical protein